MKDTKKPHAMELLAPAGSVESFRTAIDAGANAVYLGLTDFNARLRARNFTMKTLSYAVPFAHSRGVKVYVTFNTLVKQAELERAVHFLYQLDQIGVDGVIVADLGVIRIAAAEFPRLRLHGSTQMSVHNGAGVEASRLLGIRRVVVARELTLKEIGRICASGNTEIEVFVHGALCYSLSGMCLASSFFGGSSGNRGRCTQVCRRAFDRQPADPNALPGYFFSAHDLSLVDRLPLLARAGVASIKIEGRMKPAAYVGTVVRALRMALDHPEETGEAKLLLAGDMARRKTRLFMDGLVHESLIDPLNPPGTGTAIGTIDKVEGLAIFVETGESLAAGDLLRVQPKIGTEGIMAAAVAVFRDNGTTRIVLDKELACGCGDAVYRVGAAGDATATESRFNVRPARYNEECRDARSIVRRQGAAGERDANRDRRLFVKIDSYGWLPLLCAPEVGGVVCAFDANDAARLAQDSGAQKQLGRAAYIEPPPFVPDEDFGQWRRLVARLCVDGDFGLMCGNLGHAALAHGVKRVRADYGLWCLNCAAQAAYSGLGMGFFSYSLEDDSMNIRDCASQNGMLYLFTHAPLFVSRMRPAVPPGSRIADRLGRTAFTAEKYGLHYLVAEETVCLFNKRERLEEQRINTFCVDLSFMEPSPEILSEILSCYREKRKYEGSCLFNFKGGLK